MDLPLITEATNEYYRSIYADPVLGPIFRGINMVVLRQHVSYFIHQLTMFDTPMTNRQLEYLRKVHLPVVVKHGVTQQHYDLMVSYLVEAMRTNGAEENHLTLVQMKLQPLRDMFPPAGTSMDDCMQLYGQKSQQQQQCPHLQSMQESAVATGAPSSSSLYSGGYGSFYSGGAGSSIYSGGQSSSMNSLQDEQEQKHACAEGPKTKHHKGRFTAWAKKVVKSFTNKQ